MARVMPALAVHSGILVTTSYSTRRLTGKSREGGHPVVVLAGRDVVERLKARGLDNTAVLTKHLRDAYPMQPPRLLPPAPCKLDGADGNGDSFSS